MWERLSEPWRECVELAWEAYRAGSLPIGAVVTDASGAVISKGRNRIHESSGDEGTFFGHRLAHAEVNALATFEHGRRAFGARTLWTTTEPCPMCAGAARMADVGTVRYAAREPWGGSAEMFRTVPYMARGRVRVIGPRDPRLEAVLVAMKVDRFMDLRPSILDTFLGIYGELMPEATAVGRQAHGSGLLRRMSDEGTSADAVVQTLDARISSAT